MRRLRRMRRPLPAIRKMKKNILIILIVIPTLIFAQEKRDKDIFVVNNDLKIDSNLTIEELTLKLSNPLKKDIDKVRIIYTWIATNIEYDEIGYEKNYWTKYPSVDSLVSDTYRLKKGVCSGYSYLFKKMLSFINIESKVIDGYSRTELNDFYSIEINHSWNTVNLDGKWRLFDVTWASNHKEIGNMELWFDASPENFILSHFPQNEEWILLDEEIKLPEFLKSPIYTNCYYELNKSKIHSREGVLKVKNDTIKIKIILPSDVEIFSKIYDEIKNEWLLIKTIKSDEEDQVIIPFKKNGDFILKIGGYKNDNNGFWICEEIAYFMIKKE